MRLRLLTTLAFLGALLASAPAWAIISVDPGTYEVPAIVVHSTGGPTAVFNVRTHSECRVLLKGPAAVKLDFEGLKGLRLKFVVSRKFLSKHVEAELLEAQPLADDAHIPARVGNNFRTIK